MNFRNHLHTSLLLLLCAASRPCSLAADIASPTEADRPELQSRSATSLSLDQALAEAMTKAPSLLAAEAEVEAARGEAETAQLRPPTELSFTPGWKRTREGDGTQHEFKGTFSLSRQLVFASRRTLLRAAAEKNVELRQLAIEGLRFQLQASVRRHYAELLAAQESVVVREAQLDAARHFHESAEERVRKGFAPELEVLKARSEWITAQRLLREAEAQRQEARMELNSLLGREPSNPLEITAAEPPVLSLPSLEELNARALAVHPAFKILALQSEIAGLKARNARLAGKSEVSIGPSVEYSRSEQVLGVSMTLSLPDKRSGQGELRAASAEQRRINAEREQLKRETRSAVAAAVARHTALAGQLALYDDAHLASLQAAVTQAEKAYASNASSLALLLETRRSYHDTLAERQSLLGELLAAQSELEALVGATLTSIKPSLR